jgi:AraC-like DNA-binding protein
MGEPIIEWGRSADLAGVVTLCVSGSDQAWRWFHETYSFCNALGDGGRGVDWLYRGKMQSGTAGNTFFMEPGETHVNTRVNGPLAFEVAFVDAAAVESLARELAAGAAPHFGQSQIRDRRVQGALGRVVASVRGQGSALERQSRFARFVEIVLSEYAERKPARSRARWEQPALRRVRDHIHDHLAEDVTLGDLARVARMNRFHLLRVFTRAVGMPPHQYQLCARINAAGPRLARGERAAQVAMDLGFADQSHFGRHFRRIVGVSPGRYAATLRG